MEGKVHVLSTAKISPTNLNKTLLYFSTFSNFPETSTLVEVFRNNGKGDNNQCLYTLEL